MTITKPQLLLVVGAVWLIGWLGGFLGGLALDVEPPVIVRREVRVPVHEWMLPTEIDMYPGDSLRLQVRTGNVVAIDSDRPSSFTCITGTDKDGAFIEAKREDRKP